MRLSNIVTRTGDAGKTSIGSGERVSKDHPRIHAMGAVDHLNSIIGWSVIEASKIFKDDLKEIQNDLFDLGAELAVPSLDNLKLKKERLDWLDNKIKEINSKLEPLTEFILPGGTEFASRLHIARTECRHAERQVVPISAKSDNNQIPYLNRLSDYLFVAARSVNSKKGQKENMWKNKTSNEL